MMPSEIAVPSGRAVPSGSGVPSGVEERAAIEIRPLGRPGDLGWVVMAHGELYTREFGWGPAFESLVARIVADYAGTAVPGRDAAWIAEQGGRRVGCVFCVSADAPADGWAEEAAAEETTAEGAAPGRAGARRVAQLRILLVDPAVRGQGLGGRLVDECLAFAVAAGYRRMRLWTNHPLLAARAVYLSRGFELVSEDERPHHDFGVPLTGQVYERDLTATVPPAPGVRG